MQTPDYSAELALLAAGMEKTGLSCEDTVRERFRIYLHELSLLQHNLTAVKDPRQVVLLHFLDSLSVLPLLRFEDSSLFCDLGSGAGFPLLPLKIIRPAWQCVFLDSRQKSLDFILQTTGRMGLSAVEAVHGHTAELKRKKSYRSFDEVLVRALGPVARVLEQSYFLVRPGGRLTLYKGPGHTAEMEEAAGLLGKHFTHEETLPVSVPFLDRERYILTFRRLPS